MGPIEHTIVDWISEDNQRLSEFVTLLGETRGEEEAFAGIREKLSQLAPDCGKFWRSLLVSAIAEADWKIIAAEITDRRRLENGGGAWVMVDRRKP